MAEIPKRERILNLISFLLKSAAPVTWKHIRDQVEGYSRPDERDASVMRRFERDKTTIRQLGVRIQYTYDDGAGREGYFIAPANYFLPRVEFSPEEVAILALVSRAAPASGAFEAAIRSALAKLQFDSPIPGDVRSTVEERYLFHQPAPEDPAEAPKLESLIAAILDNKTITFAYAAPRPSPAASPAPAGAPPSTSPPASARRTVDPYGLAFWSGHWYLAGYCHARRAIRTFRTDRILRRIRRLNPGPRPDFVPPQDFDIERFVGRPPWQLGGGQELRVTVRLDDTIAWMIHEQSVPSDRWHLPASPACAGGCTHADRPRQAGMRPDGSATLERTITDAAAFFSWLRGLGGHAELLGPPDLRRRFIADLRGLHSLYSQTPGTSCTPAAGAPA